MIGLKVLFYSALLAGLFISLKGRMRRLPGAHKIRLISIAVFAFLFLIKGDLGFKGAKNWLVNTRISLSLNYARRNGANYDKAVQGIFPWYGKVAKFRAWILEQGEKTVRLQCPDEGWLRESIAVVLYPVRLDPSARLTLEVVDTETFRFRLVENSP